MASAHAQRIAAVMANEMLASTQANNTAQLQDGYAKARTDLVQNADQANKSLDYGQANSLAALGKGYDDARTAYGQAATLYQPYVDVGQKAMGQYADAAGVNGQAGYDAAVGNFHASPGYQYQVDEASDAVARKAASLGVAGSGNTMAAISDRAQHLADQDYGQYMDRLNGLSATGYSATGAQANIGKAQGDLSAAQGTATSNLFDVDAARYATIRTGLGASLAGLDTGLPTTLSNQALQVAGAMGGNANSAGQATDAAKNSNQNLLLGALGLGLKGASMLSGGFGSLGSFGAGSSISRDGTSWT